MSDGRKEITQWSMAALVKTLIPQKGWLNNVVHNISPDHYAHLHKLSILITHIVRHARVCLLTFFIFIHKGL